MNARNKLKGSGLRSLLPCIVAFVTACGCVPAGEDPETGTGAGEAADLLLVGGRVYTLAWADPDTDGAPAPDAPVTGGNWQPDAEAVAIKDGLILFVGSGAEAEAYRGDQTRVIDVAGATVLPGFVDTHVHVAGLGQRLEQVDLAGGVPPGEWIVGWGWDEGAWADRYPTADLLSRRVPDHPVLMRGLHGFAVWGNRMALERAGITAETETPSGGEIRRDAEGRPTGTLINRATNLLTDALPVPSATQIEDRVVTGLEAMAEAGYVMVHQAGADADLMAALEALDVHGKLPIRVYAMLSGRDVGLLEERIRRGPEKAEPGGDMLITRSVKAYFDGALGSRGALMLEDYSDMPGERGTGATEYGFSTQRIARLMAAGFQPGIHAIGDAGNRLTLDFIEGVLADHPEARAVRPRIEHAQIVHPEDIPRFGHMGLIAAMQPPHQAEDKTWAEDRLGPERIRGAYAWRSLRRAGAVLAFSSDLPGSDYDIRYGLHAAVTRRDRDLQPVGGWQPQERLTPEEAVRGYTSWAAYSAHLESLTGILAPGMWADLTILSRDLIGTPADRYEEILESEILWTIVGGRVVHGEGN
jgi:predicted amidohydrolase YtcJ